jgi:hypothetical protein
MRFSSDFRSDILTEALRFSHLFCEKFSTTKVRIEKKKKLIKIKILNN